METVIGGIITFFIIIFSAPETIRESIKEDIQKDIYESNETKGIKNFYKGDKIIRYKNPNC
jgi:hypothetical protein